jgi:hypothetical protein
MSVDELPLRHLPGPGQAVQVKNWVKYQVAHTTEFLKLVHAMHDDPDWLALDLLGRGLWVSILLAAAHTRNQIPYTDWVTFNRAIGLTYTTPNTLKALFDLGWIVQNVAGSEAARRLRHTYRKKGAKSAPDEETISGPYNDMGEEKRVLGVDLEVPNGTSRPTPKTREGAEKLGASRQTWITPFWDAYLERYPGATPHAGMLARALRPLVQLHGEPKVLEHWRCYLSQTEARYVSAPRFAATFPAWVATKGKRRTAPRHLQ